MIFRLDRILFGTCAVLVGGSLLLAAPMPALAGQHGGGGFREFRSQNSGLDRHAARRMFNADRQIDRVLQSRGLPVPAGTVPSSRAQLVRTERQFARINAIDVRRQSFQANERGGLVRLNSGIDLDLTSGNANIVLGNNLFSGAVSSIEINVGGETKTLTAGSHVTAAEYVAAKQVLIGHSQSVLIDGSGAASGGSIDLGSLTQDNDVMRASNLVVSSNVTTSGDFGRHSDFRLTGDLVNYGTINALSSDSNVRGGAIRAEDISNHTGGLINSSVDLTLEAAGNLNNDGMIVSSHGLTLIAGSSLNNAGTIRATDHVNVQSATINNSGLIRSTSADVNLDGPATAALSVNNVNGTIAALNGAINVRNTAYSGTSGGTVNGGDLLSRELNLNSGQGLVEVNVNQLTGAVSGTGSAAHVSANTDVLTIGNVCLTGDPTFYNQGDISIESDLIVLAELVIVASGNITSKNDLTIQSGDAFNGHNITMIAGADFEAFSGDNNPTLPGKVGTAGDVTLSGKSSKTGGGIQLGSNVQVLAQSNDTIGSDSGGNILMAAFGGKGPIAGKILFTGATLDTSGLPGGENGNVTIIAGAKTGGTVVDVGVIDTVNGTNGSLGLVNIVTASPVSAVKNQPIIYDKNGALVSGSLIASTKLNRGADIHVGNQSSGTEVQASNDTTFSAGGNIKIEGQVTALNKNITLRTPGTITGAAFSNVNANTMDLEAGGDIGTDALKFRVDTTFLTINSEKASKGANTFIQTTGVAPIQVHAELAKGQLVIDASTTNAALFANTARIIDLKAQQLLGSALLGPKGADSITLTTLDPTFDLSDVTFGGIKGTLTLNSARDVGSAGLLNNIGKVKNIVVNAGRDSYFSITDKKTSVSINAGRDIALTATNGLTINSATATTGSFAANTSGGSIAVKGNVIAGTQLDIASSSAKTSSKISFAANTQIKGDNVFVSVGTVTGTPAPAVANLDIQGVSGGAALLSGAGAKAKAPLNTVLATGAGHTILINNGFKSGNLSFGGGVSVTAD